MDDAIPDPASSPVETSPISEAPAAAASADAGLAYGAVQRAAPPLTANPPGSTVYDPTTAPGVDLNPRSCTTCRRRKVRCDKHMPCSNCRRAHIPCVFPAPERAPRRPRRRAPNVVKPQSSERELELVKRLRKLEGIVEELSGQIELETTRQHSGSADSPEETAAHGSGGGGGDTSMVGPEGPEGAESPSGASIVSGNSPAPLHARLGGDGAGQPVQALHASRGPQAQEPRTARDQPSDMHSNKIGRLLNDKGRRKYVSNAFWSKINDEVSFAMGRIMSWKTD